jgi:alkanesulfonate monooxygenase SsuD/methylene tetrahydromethanopterin reductase-like flavin-dependent oxidoreductase (luciferase family)
MRRAEVGGRAMRFGVLITSPYPGDVDPALVREHIRQQATLASANNFDGLFAAQHYLTGPHSAMLQPIPTLAYLAALAPGLYLGTSIFLLPLHSPVDVAEQVATLDILCEGRLLFGVGQGYRDAEFRSFGLDRRTRRPRLAEGIQLTRRLWAEDDVTFHGEFFRVDGVSIAPKPIQRPGPPILVGADTVRTVGNVPDIGDHWIASRRHSKTFLCQALPAYKAGLARQGRPFEGLFLFRDLCMAESATQAETRIKDAYERMYRLYRQWGQPGEAYDPTFEELKRERLIVGSPDDVADQVLGYHREFGAEFMWFTVYWPGMDPAWSLETIRLFGERVIPAIKRATSASSSP